jgi:peptide deformylase
VAVREVLRYPHPALKQTASPVDPGRRAEIARLAADLADTMAAHSGCVGLAAPQLGELARMIVVDVTGDHRAASSSGRLVLVNPRIVGASGTEIAREGCLSIPDFTANVRRATEIVVAAVTPEGDARRIESEGFEARCLLHEIDHLDGILFLDRVASVKNDVFRRKRYR